jgi:hypothetical protein
MSIYTVLEYFGFALQVNRTDITADGFESFNDILTMSETNIGSLSKGFTERTMANGKIIFGLRRTNFLKATVHWVQDFRRISREATLDGVADAAAFKIEIEMARQRALIRRHNANESDTLSKAIIHGLQRCTVRQPRQIATLESTGRHKVYGFNAGRRKISLNQGRASVVYTQLELDSHADTIVYGSNWTIVHFTGK